MGLKRPIEGSDPPDEKQKKQTGERSGDDIHPQEESAKSKKRKKDVADGEHDTFTVQTSWKNFCRSTVVKEVVAKAVPAISRAIAEAWLLLGMHVFRLFDEDLLCVDCMSDYVIDQMLFYRAIAITFDGGRSGDLMLQSTYDDNFGNVEYVKQSRPKGAAYSCMINAAARMMKTNFVNHIDVHFQSRHEGYVKWKVIKESETMNLQFFLNNRRRIDSSVRLVRTLTLWYRDKRVRDALPSYPAMAEIPEQCIQMLEKLVQRVRDDMGVDYADKTGFKLRWMRFMLRDMEAEMRRRETSHVIDWPGGHVRLRTYSLTPQSCFQPTFVQLDETSIRHMPIPGEKFTKAECPKENMFRGLFNVSKVLSRGQEGRGWNIQSVKTNGWIVSVVINRLRPPEPSGPGPVLQIPENVIAVDPGRRQFLRYGTVSLSVHQDFTATYGITSKRFYTEAGYTKRTKTVARDMDSDSAVSEFNRTAPTCKTADPLIFALRVRSVLTYIERLMEFHGRKKYAKLRWNVSIMKKKKIDAVCKEMTGGNAGVVVAFGDASMGGGRGIQGPTKEIRRRLASHHCRVVDVDEFRTSVTCSKCAGGVGDVEVCKRTIVEEDGIPTVATVRHRPHALRVCSNPLCRTVWDRDVNAVRNIGYVCLYRFVHGGGSPPGFGRRVELDDVD